MSRPLRRLSGRALVVLAILALATTALTPRGLLRVAAANDLDRPEFVERPGAVLDTTPSDDIELPGVRVVVAREELDADQLFEAMADETAVPLETSDEPDELARAHVVDVAPPVAAAPPRPSGDRAPPLSI